MRIAVEQRIAESGKINERASRCESRSFMNYLSIVCSVVTVFLPETSK